MLRVGGGEPRKTAGPILRGAASCRTLQEGPNEYCGFRAHPPTRSGGEHWLYFGSGRFGDTKFSTVWQFVFSAIAFFRGSPLRGRFGFRPVGLASSRAHKILCHLCSCPRYLDTTSSDAPMQFFFFFLFFFSFFFFSFFLFFFFSFFLFFSMFSP